MARSRRGLSFSLRYGSLKVVDQRISGYGSRIKLNGKKTVFLCLASCVDETGDGSEEYCLCPSLVARCSGRIVMVEAEHLDLVYVLGFRPSNDRGFSRMTVLGTVTSRKNVRGSIERSIVGLFRPISWFYEFHSYVVVATARVPRTLISCQIPSTLHFSLCMGLIRLLMFHTSLASPPFAALDGRLSPQSTALSPLAPPP